MTIRLRRQAFLESSYPASTTSIASAGFCFNVYPKSNVQCRGDDKSVKNIV